METPEQKQAREDAAIATAAAEKEAADKKAADDAAAAEKAKGETPPPPPEPEKLYTAEDMKKLREKYQKETREERDARIKAEARAEILAEQAAKKPETPPAKEPDPPKRPARGDFDSTEEFDEAMAVYAEQVGEFKARQVLKDYQKEQEKKSEEDRKSSAVKTEEQKAQDAFNAHLETGRKKYVDFDAVVRNEEVPITQDMLRAILRRENNADISYFLGTNPKEAARIAVLPLADLVAEIGALSYQLKKDPPKAIVTDPTKKTTNAPPPGETIDAKNNVTDKDTTLQGKSQEKRIALLEEASRKRRLAEAGR